MRSPQRRTHRTATKFIDPWLPRDEGQEEMYFLRGPISLSSFLRNYRKPKHNFRSKSLCHPSAFGCDEGSAQPTAAYALQSNEMLQRDDILQHSDATNAICNPQRRTHCRATKFFGIRLRRTQCAAHSGARTAEQRNSCAFGCDEGNA